MTEPIFIKAENLLSKVYELYEQQKRAMEMKNDLDQTKQAMEQMDEKAINSKIEYLEMDKSIIIDFVNDIYDQTKKFILEQPNIDLDAIKIMLYRQFNRYIKKQYK